MIVLFDIGFINIRILDILDILIVAYFLYILYKLLKGTIAFNIIIGVLVFSIIWWLVNILNMQLLKFLLGKFVGFGVIILIIIFQPEIRRFLLYLGNSTLKGRFKFINKYFYQSFHKQNVNINIVKEIHQALINLAKEKTGALVVFTDFNDSIINENNGVLLDARISHELIESIFKKESPLHDGAMIIIGNRIYSVGTILPVSHNTEISSKYGTRHRAAIGMTEIGNSEVLIVSEETGEISYAKSGQLESDLNEEKVYNKILAQFKL